MGYWNSIHRAEVIHQQARIVCVVPIVEAIKFRNAAVAIIGRIDDEVGTALVLFSYKCHNLSARPWIIDVADVELLAQFGIIRQHPL